MVDRICPMDINNTTLSNIHIESLQKPAMDVLNKLQQSGLFRALVVETNGKNVLLDTAFGELKGLSPEKLNKGDEILARVLPSKSGSTLKIEQIITAKQTLPDNIVKQLIKLVKSLPATNNATISKPVEASVPSSNQAASLPLAIKVLNHSTDKTLLQINQKTYTIPRQTLLEKGETLLLKINSNNKVEVLRAQPENILKNALSHLLPRLTQQKNTPELTHLQKIISNTLKLSLENSSPIKTTLNNSTLTISKTEINSLATRSNTSENQVIQSAKSNNLSSQLSVLQKETPVKEIEQLLSRLSFPMIKTDHFNAASVQKILTMLSLVKPTGANQNNKGFSVIPDTLNKLHDAIKTSPENFKLLMRHILNSNSGDQKMISDSALSELSGTLKSEILNQVEQTISQLQVQKTTIRLNQELNQPIQINISIPIQIKEEITPLKLIIKERNKNEDEKEKSWDIHLSFEFALLGLISTNILLQDLRLSAHFWAEKKDTKNLIDSHMDQFKNQLKKSGFELGLFDCFIGKPATQDNDSYPTSENLVDINV